MRNFVCSLYYSPIGTHKTVLNMNHVTSTVVKFVNFVGARGLNHRQFISMLQDLGAQHIDVSCH